MNMKKILFAKSIVTDLLSLGEVLYVRFKGDVGAARAEIRRVKEHWANWSEENARIDAENAALKAQGK